MVAAKTGKSKSAKSKKAGATNQENKKRTTATENEQAATLPTDWAQTVLNQLVEAQKTWFEIASQQNALLLETVTQVMELTRSAPTTALAGWARQGIEGFVEAQRRWSEIAVQQSEQILKSVQSGASFSTSQKGTQAQGIEALVKMRIDWLDFAAQQNAQVISVMKESLNLDDSSPVAAFADFTQQAVNNYIDVQKRWLDLAMQLPFMGGAPDGEPKK
ncbi:MAG TPA: hypothetical protein VM911_12010 [Pyrinomonadaceae bacterium]|nr:hypothetical protein [Pyrinomonadaceae bacterium]